MLLGLLQVLVLLPLLEEHGGHLGLQDPGGQKSRCSETEKPPRVAPALLGRQPPHSVRQRLVGKAFPHGVPKTFKGQGSRAGGD